MSEDNDIINWHREEYKLLSEHYFHEDNYFLRTMTIYLGLNTALIAIGASKYFSVDSWLINYAVPIFGLVSCMLWFFSLVRIYHVRVTIEKRIKKVEVHYGKNFELSLRIRNVVSENASGMKTWPVAVLMRIFPVMLGVIWIFTLLRDLCRA